MNKPIDEEAAARGALARKLAMACNEHARTFQGEGKRKCPDLDAIRSTCETLSECIDGYLTAYDRKHGTVSERTATKFRLRISNSKLVRHTDELIQIDARQQGELAKREALLRQSVDLVESLVALCQSHGIAIPPELMGPPQ